MRTTRLKFIFAPTMPLLVGGLIYILWRSPSLLMFRWFDALGMTAGIANARVACHGVRPYLPAWVLYSLPDSAWASAGLLLFAGIWSGSRSRARHFWVLLPPALAVGGEFAQLFRILPGTFDIADVIVCSFISLVSLYLANRLFAYAL